MKPAAKKEVVAYLVENHRMSIRQACGTAHLNRSSYYYVEKGPDKDDEVIDALEALALKHPTAGFPMMFNRLRNNGCPWNHKRVYRVYKSLNMNLKRRRKRPLPKRDPSPLEAPCEANSVWSMDFMSDSLYHGRRFRTFNVIDEYNREACWLEIGISIDSRKVVEILENLVAERGAPEKIRVDNGPEFTSFHFRSFCKRHDIHIAYIEPGKPTQNAFIERFNRSYRTEVLDVYIFKTLKEVREISHAWIEDYNHHRPHSSLGYLSPIDFAKQQLSAN